MSGEEKTEMPVRALNSPRHGTAFRLGRRMQALAVLACARLLRWHELSRQRRAVLALNERMLKDIGITRGEAECEARRPFWSDGIDWPADGTGSDPERMPARAPRISGYPKR
jgi:uncharacterized protein YjiS (DUF1127 family)